ncbi:hypothetical protein [Flavobacterium foetidum]|uniref:hypothetical protein n=1 Tax=Flavobacterium foetidum TaxID=2026681 RepID=UPI001074D608|nr:hypothetical protein [Flavobacterium foetidum]KAF2513416.1 hypothetical protein E0W73_14295 [Flavobacterium foetidum]
MKKNKLFFCIALLSVFNAKLVAQSYKSESLYTYNYILPENYLPIDYYTYGIKIHLPEDPVSIIVDGEKKRSGSLLSYNEFFREKNLITMLVGTSDESTLQRDNVPTFLELGYTSRDVESVGHFIIDVTLKNLAYVSDIKESRGVETPFSYEIFYKYDVVYKLLNSVSKEVIMEKTFNVKEKMLGSGSFEGYKASFKTKPEAVSYLTDNSDKNLIYNEMVGNIEKNMRIRLAWWLDVNYYQDTFFFYKISKEDKNPYFLKLNQDYEILEKWSKGKGEPILDEALITEYASFIEKNKLNSKDNSIYFQDKKRLKNYHDYLAEKKVLTDFIVKMDHYAKQFDPNDKGQKAAMWACYMNISTAFLILNKYESSLEYIQKARALDYQEKKVKYAEDEVSKKQKAASVFLDSNGEVKKDVNSKYLKYLSL